MNRGVCPRAVHVVVVPDPPVVVLAHPERSAATENGIRLTGCEHLPGPDDLAEREAFELLDQYVDVVRHDTPLPESVAQPIEVDAGLADQVAISGRLRWRLPRNRSDGPRARSVAERLLRLEDPCPGFPYPDGRGSQGGDFEPPRPPPRRLRCTSDSCATAAAGMGDRAQAGCPADAGTRTSWPRGTPNPRNFLRCGSPLPVLQGRHLPGQWIAIREESDLSVQDVRFLGAALRIAREQRVPDGDRRHRNLTERDPGRREGRALQLDRRDRSPSGTHLIPEAGDPSGHSFPLRPASAARPLAAGLGQVGPVPSARQRHCGVRNGPEPASCLASLSHEMGHGTNVEQ